MPLLNCKNILIVRTDRIGDVVLTTPVFKALRTAYPSSRISVLVTPLTAELVEDNPYIDEVLTDDRKGRHKGFLGLLHLARDIRRRNFDTAFIYHTKRRYNLACFLAGILNRFGYQNDKFGFLLNRPVKDTRQLGLKHEAEYCLDLLKEAGVKPNGVDVFISANKEAEVWAANWFKDNNLTPGAVIAIHAGASDSTRLWPAASYGQLINALTSRFPYKVLLIGGNDMTDIAQNVLRNTHADVLNLIGQVSVAQTASILRRCRLMISGDSGPMHVGSGVGLPVICLFLRNQPGINPQRWRPLGPYAITLVPKAGDEIILDKQGKISGGKADSITVDEVIGAVERTLSQDSQSLFYW
jgi:heptosyltransferase II